MIIACLGDSLTEGDYGVFGKRGIANVQPEGYPYFLSGLLGAEVRNFGKCGRRASNYLEYYKSGSVKLDGADLIIIMLGTNGGNDVNSDTLDNRCYKALIESCRTDAPNARIVLCTPPHVTSNPKYSNCGYADRVAMAVKFVRALAAELELDLIDVAKCPYFTEETEDIMQPNDGLHFGRAGYEAMAKFIAEELKKIL